ncbi:MAG: (Fe-S)-binding protein [Bradymonadaceae bacterium]|nr:(Fe-S)-binding protein [Lujinxingiaceae bacterium]
MAKKVFGEPIDRMTAYCTYCPKMCRFSCPTAQAENRETVTPWALMRLFELVKDDAVQPSEEVAEAFHHCTGCLRCQNWCRHDNDVPQSMWEARAWMAELGHVPKALEGLVEQFKADGSALGSFPELGSLEDVFDPRSSVAFMPDCETRRHYPELVLRAGRLLALFNGAPVRLITRLGDGASGCCGSPLLSAGFKDAYRAHREKLEAELGDVDLVITDCASMASLHRTDTSWGWKSRLEVVHLIEFLAKNIDYAAPVHEVDTSGLMIHDSCYIGRQLELYEPYRVLARALGAEDPGEFQFNRAEASCCGAGGNYHQVVPAASEQCAKDILEQMELEGGKGLICGSPNCKRAFQRVGAEAIDILELACKAYDL